MLHLSPHPGIPSYCVTIGSILLLAFVPLVMSGQPEILAAQSATPVTCTQALSNAQESLNACSTLDRDQVCYGNQNVEVSYQDSAMTGQAAFAKAGDILPLRAIKTIQTSALDLEHNLWGIAATRAQAANQDNTDIGKPVAFLLYGDAVITQLSAGVNATTLVQASKLTSCTATVSRVTYLRGAPGFNQKLGQLLSVASTVDVYGRLNDNSWIFANFRGNTGWLSTVTVKLNCDANSLPVVDPEVPAVLPSLSEFELSTSAVDESLCRDIPPGGLLVQTPFGRTTTFVADGIRITFSATILLRAVPCQTMNISVIDGTAWIESQNSRVTLNAAQQVSVPIGGITCLQSSGPPGRPWPVYPFSGKGGINLKTVCALAKANGIDVHCSLSAPPAASQVPGPGGQEPPTVP